MFVETNLKEIITVQMGVLVVITQKRITKTLRIQQMKMNLDKDEAN